MLEEQRRQIDDIDRQIVKLFEQRNEVVTQVAQIKLAHNIPVLDSSREAKVIEKVQSYCENDNLKDDIATLYTHIMALSRGQQTQFIEKH